ncbi:MAG: BREX-2 system adenine-specific DNA-methyltransferase PglX, partial [Verrucomicrobia bacterium]|nr:BREX-2 system adenine-specific DNA-methyltransferase PglX [Verrucomicrobiota bacterium]
MGNPPNITVKDKALNEAYRSRFDSCHGNFALVAPFMERFFDLTLDGSQDGARRAGWVGMIVANSFMKAEFGKKLIQVAIPQWDLTHVIDTSGAEIPGHDTPTVILLGKHQPPVAPTVRTVMSIKSEPAKPENPALGLVWTAILAQVDEPGSEGEFVSVADISRSSFSKHPWNIGGGGAAELKDLLDGAADRVLDDLADSIGFASFPGLDDAFIADEPTLRRAAIPEPMVRDLVNGDVVRDWAATSREFAITPYNDSFDLLSYDSNSRWARFLWLNRASLEGVLSFGGKTRKQLGDSWWGWYRWIPGKYQVPLSITYGFVATHNHFALDRGGKVFNRTAPVIKLLKSATEQNHLVLLGLLNSAAACFWARQTFFPRGGFAEGKWQERLNWNCTPLGRLPLPKGMPATFGCELDGLAQDLKSHAPAGVLATSASHTSAALDAAKQRWTETLQRMIALQEELDWECYRLYGLLAGNQYSVISNQVSTDNCSLITDNLPLLKLGERAFEIVMARKLAAGELQTTWFGRHRSTPITELPSHWPQPYRELVQRRIALMESDRNIALIEQPEYKRRWNVEPWDEQLERALREWLLNGLECYFYGGEWMVECGTRSAECGMTDGQTTISDSLAPRRGEGLGAGSAASLKIGPSSPQPSPPAGGEGEALARLRHSFLAGQQPAQVSTNQLATVVETDADFLRVAEIYTGGPGFSVSKLVRELVEAESVPFLPLQRYKDTGLRKRQDWEHVWALQRKEDAI